MLEANAQDVVAVALAERIVAIAGQVAVRPRAGLITGERDTLPAKLFRLVRETEMLMPVAPELKFTGVPRLTLKSPT